MAETRAFQAQTKKLLDLMIHSIYSHKEIFLRELISNASDAIDKARFEALTRPEMSSEWQIKLIPDKGNHTLTITDNGVGMSHDEVIEHIGTIAKSGSETYARAQQPAAGGTEMAAPDLIGQFGVGFYSAFMVAKKVVLETQKTGEAQAVRWESSGDGEYTIENIPARERGTSVTLYLRDRDAPPVEEDEDDSAPVNEQDFTDPWELRKLVKKYSDFIAFPVVMDVEKFDRETDADGKPVEGGKTESRLVAETLNSMKALWTRTPSQIGREEYDEFYKHLTHDWNHPSDVIHFHAEGQHEWTALLYIPKTAPFDLYSREPKRGLSLYIKRVFISEDVKALVPEHFRFIKGMVDSSDLPLNMSRETVQTDPLLALMRKRITGKVMSHLKDVQEKERERYETLWDEYGQCIKEGFHYDVAQKDKLADLVLVYTTGGTTRSTLKEVAERMKEGQSALYYLTGDKLDVLREAPQLEVFRKRGVEVVLLPEPVDEIMVGVLETYAGKKLQSAAKGELEGLPETEAETKQHETEAVTFATLLERLKKMLSDDVQDVRISQRLTDSAVCLVADETGMSPQLERMMASMGQAVPPQKRVLELNATHPAIVALRDLADRDKDDARLQDYAEMLLDQALLAEGTPLKNPAKFARRVAEVMAQAAAH